MTIGSPSSPSLPAPPTPLGMAAPPPPEDPVILQQRRDWLSFHRLWGTLPDEALHGIAQALVSFCLPVDTQVYDAGQTPVGLYLVKWGTVELYRRSPIGNTHILYRNAGSLFGYVPLMQAEPDSTYQTSAKTLSPSELWFLGQADFERLTQTYPAIHGIISQLLAQDLAHVAERITWEETRIQGLQDYLHPVPHQPEILGTSKASQALRRQAIAATADLKPVLLKAPPGSGKTFIASFIHHHSRLGDRPFAELDCTQLPSDDDGRRQTHLLFGHSGETLGILDLLEQGTLLIDHVERLHSQDRDRLIHYAQTGLFTPNSSAVDPDPSPKQSWVRLILASDRSLPVASLDHHDIKLFPLSQRKADIPDFVDYFLVQSTQHHNRDPIQVDQTELRRLISYAYPGNLVELSSILDRAVTMTPPGQMIVPEQVLWSVQSSKNAFRIDLLEQYPWLRRMLLSRWWPDGIWWVMMAVFIPVTLLGYIGPQHRASSITLNLFWAWWWPFYLFLFAFVGRLWCAVCPFMIAGEWVRRLSLWIWPRSLRPWPTKWMERWGPWLLFGGFLIIYLWEKLWDLPHTAYLSSWLLVAITAGAVICSLIYERRLWCRYLCPIGGMNGMFAKLSIVELRASQQVCGSQCRTFGCYKGSGVVPPSFSDALPNEGQATGGCPIYSHPAQLKDNRNCVLCMTCLKACPHRSIQVNVRFPATDLLDDHQGLWAEAALLLLLLGGVVMHQSQTILQRLGWAMPLDAVHLGTSLPIVLGLLSIPALLIGSTHQLSRWLDPQQPGLLSIIYAYLPLTLAANLAHYVPAAITEAGQALPVLARTLGYGGDRLPVLVWSLDVAVFLQEITLLSAVAFSLYPLLRITQRPILNNLPHLALIVSMAGGFLWLMI
jgi:polyferredoxin/CRP-like cAMP-binding protein